VNPPEGNGKKELSDEDKKIVANHEVTKKEFPEEYAAALKTLKIAAGGEMSIETMTKILAEVNRLVDSSY
jgi:hypothetical protein